MNQPLILHTARYVGLPLEILQKACPQGFSVKTLDEATYEQLIKEAADADYFLVSGQLHRASRIYQWLCYGAADYGQ